MKCFNSVILVFVALIGTAIAQDYCSKDICDGEIHIGCENNGDFGPSCPAERSIVPMTTDMIDLLLKKHNTARMNIANGEVSGFPTANRMIEMSWDDELASLAAMNAKTCIFAHDKCRNTAAFQYAGQNIAITGNKPDYPDVNSAINDLFDLWFNEYVDCDIGQIHNLTEVKAENGKNFGHFTQIIMANSSKVGCAIVTYLKDSWKKLSLTCDYSQTNVISWPVYTTGSPCSGCKSGCSSSFPGLCNANEVVEIENTDNSIN